jgi:hypothetical protein
LTWQQQATNQHSFCCGYRSRDVCAKKEWQGQ